MVNEDLESKKEKNRALLGGLIFTVNIFVIYVILRFILPEFTTESGAADRRTVIFVSLGTVALVVYTFVILELFFIFAGDKEGRHFIITSSMDRLLWESGHAIATITIGSGLVMTKANKNVYRLFGLEYSNKQVLSLADLADKCDIDKLNRMINMAKENKLDTISSVIRVNTGACCRDEKSIKLSCNIVGDKMTVIFTDITSEINKGKELEAERERYKVLSEICGYTVFELTQKGDMIYKTANFDRLFGATPIGSNLVKRVIKDGTLQPSELREVMRNRKELENGKINSFEVELDVVDTTGENHFYRLIISALRETGKSCESMRLLCMTTNIDQEVETRDALKDKASLDGLTGLLNKESFKNEVDKLLRTERINSGCMVMFDIDFFKGLNDSLGHNVGDEALKDVANRIIETVRSGDLAGRFGGDEYCIFLNNINMENASKVLERLRESVVKTYRNDTGDKEFNLTISIGAVAYPDSGNKASLLINNADVALYEAKQNGKNQVKTK